MTDREDSANAGKQNPATEERLWEIRGAKLWSHWFEVSEGHLGADGQLGRQQETGPSAQQGDQGRDSDVLENYILRGAVQTEGRGAGQSPGCLWGGRRESRPRRGRRGSDSQRAEEERIVRMGRGCLPQTGRAGAALRGLSHHCLSQKWRKRPSSWGSCSSGQPSAGLEPLRCADLLLSTSGHTEYI